MNKIKHIERVNLFQKELNYFSTPSIREFAEYCLDHVPEYFFHIPASSTGKYHPSYALGEGGLVRHTKAAMGIYNELIRADIQRWYRDQSTIPFDDIVLCALLLHDTYKSGEENNGNTVFEHPLIAAKAVQNFGYEYSLDPLWVNCICICIESHMGKWCENKYSSVVLPNPMDDIHDNWACRLVHLCDYLASRKCLEYQFNL